MLSVPKSEEFFFGDCYWLDGCDWFTYDNIKFESRMEKLIKQVLLKKIIKRKLFVKYIKSREFNEWFYAPNGIGGRTHKKNMLKSLEDMNFQYVK